MQRPPTLFFDFDDTLSDPIPFFLQFAHAFGTFLHERFGGDVDAWGQAAAEMFISVEDDYKTRFIGNPTNGYLDWLKGLQRRGMQQIFETMGIPTPDDIEKLGGEAQFIALAQSNAAFPGAEQAVKTLLNQGYTLHMASGQESAYLTGGLMGLGLLSCFRRLFGPDLIDCAKEGPEYYTRMFAAAGVSSEEAIVIDDYPPAIGWAVATGAKVIQAKLSPIRQEETQPGVVAVVTDLHTLPDLIAQIAEA